MRRFLTLALVCIILTGCANIEPGLPVSTNPPTENEEHDLLVGGEEHIDEPIATEEPLTVEGAFGILGISYDKMWSETMTAKLSGNTTMAVVPDRDGVAGMSVSFQPDSETKDTMAIYRVDDKLFYCRNDKYYHVTEPVLDELNELYFGGRTIKQFVDGCGTNVYLNEDEKQITVTGNDCSVVITNRIEAIYVKLKRGDISVSYEFSKVLYDPRIIRESLTAETRECEEMAWEDFYADFNTYLNEHTRFSVDEDGTVHAPGCGCGSGEKSGTCTAGCC